MFLYLTRSYINFISKSWILSLLGVTLFLVVIIATLTIDIVIGIPSILIFIALTKYLTEPKLKKALILIKEDNISDKDILLLKYSIGFSFDRCLVNEYFDKIYNTKKITGDRMYKIFNSKDGGNFPYKEKWIFHSNIVGIPGLELYTDYKYKKGTRFYLYYKKDDKGNMIPVHK